MENNVLNLEKQWIISGFFAKNIPLGTTKDHNMILMKNIASFLLNNGPFPFLLNYSCNGTTAGVPGDGVDRLDLANVSRLSGLTNNSWIVLDGQGFFQDIQIMMVASNFRLELYYSRKDPYTGGTTGTFPITTNGGDGGVIMISETYQYIDICMFLTQESDCLRIATTRPFTRDNLIIITGIERIKVYTPTNRDIIIFYSQANPQMNNFGAHAYFYNKFSDSDVYEDVIVGQKAMYDFGSEIYIVSVPNFSISSSGYYSIQSKANSINEFGAVPLVIYKESVNEIGKGYIGSMFDMFFASSYMPSFCKSANSDHFVFGGILLPWYDNTNPVI